ncbi:hypothetical protein M430DRAFT_22927 [Amorphotheca resinae ATCC 22711]|uniref:Uncharacterized protein n=1 Tax=Amorphotheca resinae ATCC 22711 TaxID=857342 RepID=A0A2T3AR11_AMORE|nr:hypothetical protein M430DRAFT_22927 [Amorphotheca resinae ATCC 22711]PSS08697.1 hypothetical protein M430DRAFT_22927 [Amorphotheca resinae ATCC 22711]
MASKSKRELIQGPLRPPRPTPLSLSYSQPPASKSEVSVRNKEASVPVVEFSSRAVPQPFLDPSIIQRRIQAAKQQEIDHERRSKLGGSSSSSQRL